MLFFFSNDKVHNIEECCSLLYRFKMMMYKSMLQKCKLAATPNPNSQLAPEADEESSDSEETSKKPEAINLIHGSIFDLDSNEEYPEAGDEA